MLRFSRGVQAGRYRVRRRVFVGVLAGIRVKLYNSQGRAVVYGYVQFFDVSSSKGLSQDCGLVQVYNSA